MTAPSAIPCLTCPTHFPNVMARPNGISRQMKISSEFVKPLGFSNGWAAFALKKPPPLVPRSLIASMRRDRALRDRLYPLVRVCTTE